MERPETAPPSRPGFRSKLKLSREPAIVAGALAAGCALAWWWLARMSTGGTGMEMGTGIEMEMPTASSSSPWAPGYLLPTFAMWAIMMVAMMLPSASPMILLFARIPPRTGRAAHVILFAACYLAVWAGFSAAATIAQALMVASGLVGEATLAIGSKAIAGGLLIAAGLYQLSPLKAACLDACRSPLSFILRLSRPGLAGTARLGLAHGAYCLGCCWALMLLLFVGGVMNLAWIAALAVIVVVEKAAPVSLRRLLSVLLVAAGAVLAANEMV